MTLIKMSPNNPDADNAASEESTTDMASLLKEIPNTPESKTASAWKNKNKHVWVGPTHREKLENYKNQYPSWRIYCKISNSGMSKRFLPLYQTYLQNNAVAKAENNQNKELLKEFPVTSTLKAWKDPNWNVTRIKIQTHGLLWWNLSVVI